MKLTDWRVIGAGLIGILAGLYFDFIYRLEDMFTLFIVGLSVIGLLVVFVLINVLAKNNQEVSKFLFVVFFICFAITFIVTWIFPSLT